MKLLTKTAYAFTEAGVGDGLAAGELLGDTAADLVDVAPQAQITAKPTKAMAFRNACMSPPCRAAP
jgi:hypothetical protein